MLVVVAIFTSSAFLRDTWSQSWSSKESGSESVETSRLVVSHHKGFDVLSCSTVKDPSASKREKEILDAEMFSNKMMGVATGIGAGR